MIGQFDAIWVKGIVPARNGRAEDTTTRLIALFRITASRATKLNAPMSSGRRNSAAKPDQPAECADDGSAAETGQVTA